VCQRLLTPNSTAMRGWRTDLLAVQSSETGRGIGCAAVVETVSVDNTVGGGVRVEVGVTLAEGGERTGSGGEW
jgi:hypothetical protein